MSNRGNPGQGRGGDRGGGRGGRGGRGGPGGGPGGGGGGGGGGFGGGGGGGGGGSGFRGGPDRGRGGSGFRGSPRGGRGGSVIFNEGVPAQLPPRLADTSLSALIAGFNKLKVTPERPIRPGYGTLGTPITLRANFFPVKVPKGPVYDYVVEIDPPPPSDKKGGNGLKARIFQVLEKQANFVPHLSYIAHDKSQRLVSARQLPQPLVITVSLDDDPVPPQPPAAPKGGKGQKKKGQKAPEIFAVNIRFERQLDMSHLSKYLDGKSQDYDFLPVVSALNLVLQQQASRTGIRVGKNRYFFPSSAQKVKLEPGVEAIQGFYASVRPVYTELMVNVNACMTAFFEPGNVADALFAFGRNSSGAMPTLPAGMAGKVKVRTKHLNRKKTIKRVGTTPARNTRFKCDDPAAGLKGEVSVEEYFLKKYKIKLRYPVELPVIDIASRTNPQPAWVPAELCDIEPGQPYGKLNDKQTAQMIRYACNPPKVNAEAIVDQGFKSLGFNPPAGPISEFGVAIDPNMAVVPGRGLPPPQLTYKVGRANVKGGSWNILDVQFHRGASVASWWVVVVRDGFGIVQGPTDPKLRDLVAGFTAKCKRSGMNMPSALPTLIPVALPSPSGDPGRLRAIELLKNTFREKMAQTKGKPSFALVLLERRDNFIYPAIKHIGDTLLGIHTVHMQLEKAFIEQKQDQYFSNVALKVNTKLGGINHLLDGNAMKWLTKEKTMLVGIDVTHPGMGSKGGTPSIAAVVASVDDSFVQFPASLRIQESKKEMLDELSDMLIERLLVYEKKNKALPKRIFVFRDGVSEGQYDIVVREELPQILDALNKLGTKERKVKYEPKLSIIICGKRHHARFFPENSAHADKNGNTLAGTVVDKGITAIYDFDFYLQAHAGLQGTVKPTHYTVVYDQNKLQADEIQQGTHTASYLYARATKAVSLIPPAYYADLACERGRCYLNNFLVDLDGKTSVSGRSKADTEDEERRVFQAAREAWGNGLHPDVRESMFYI